MAYRRKTFKKRFSKRKKTYRKKTFKRKFANSPSRYTGQLNVCADVSRPAVQNQVQGGVKFAILWGQPAATLTVAPFLWPAEWIISPYSTPEWILYHEKFQEYKIVGMKVAFMPATYIGDQTDGRSCRQLHIGSANEAFNPILLTVNRLQLSTDYGPYSMNAQRSMVKRYYKPAGLNNRANLPIWRVTSDTAYAGALTYLFWQISGVDNDAIVTGDLRVQYYIQFRKPKITQVA